MLVSKSCRRGKSHLKSKTWYTHMMLNVNDLILLLSIPLSHPKRIYVPQSSPLYGWVRNLGWISPPSPTKEEKRKKERKSCQDFIVFKPK